MEKKLEDFLGSHDALYHFTKKEIAMEYILKDMTLKFGSFSNTNDPHEYKNKTTSAFGWGLEAKHDKKISEAMQYIEEFIKASGFLSFSLNKYTDESVQLGYKKSRMWAQYGENNSGICLVFSKNLLLKDIREKLADKCKVYEQKINYSKFSETLVNDTLQINGDELDASNPKDIALQHIENNYDKALFQKQSDYKDENEYRIITISTDNSYFNETFIDISSCIKMIILGDAFPKVYYPTIDVLSKQIGIPYKKLHWEHGEYYLINA